MPRRLVWMLVIGGGLASACGGSTGPSGTITFPVPQVTCPAPQSAESPTGAPMPVAFPAPVTAGGESPVTASCIPASGANFSVGSTTVSCTARDAQQRTAACSFTVSVTRPGQLTATRFMAFGDSMTWGQLSGVACLVNATVMTRDLIRRDFETLFPRGVPIPPAPSTSYPSVLQTLLVNRYLAQSPVVFNEGNPGETVTDLVGGTYDPTLDRLRAALTARAPQVMLLQEGINDLNNFSHQTAPIGSVIKALRDMVRIGRQQNAQVFVGTLLPTDPNGCRGKLAFDLVAPANVQIRAMAASEGVPVVDLYEAFGGSPGPYFPIEDGLHPNALGYQKMAQTFLDTIRARLEK